MYTYIVKVILIYTFPVIVPVKPKKSRVRDKKDKRTNVWVRDQLMFQSSRRGSKPGPRSVFVISIA